ncbi:MAG: amidohydrolase family protein [Halobacteriales archaeon]
MSTSQRSDIGTYFDDVMVVDTDVHVSSESEEIVRKKLPWMEEPHLSNLDPDVGLDKGAASYPSHSWPDRVNEDGTAVEEKAPQVVDLQTDVYETLCQQGNVDYPIINMQGRHDRLHSSERAVQEMRANNNVLLEMLDDHPDFFGLIDLFTHDPAKAAEEIDRIGDEAQFVGVYFPTSALEKPAGHPNHDVIFRAADDHDLTMVYHGESASYLGRTPFLDEVESFMEMQTLAHPAQQMMSLTTLVIQGVPVKFPDLNHVFLQAGLGWVPYMMGRINRDYGQRPSKAPLLDDPPEEYIRRNCWFGASPLGEPDDPDDIVDIIEMTGPENIVFASDYPNHGHDFSAVDAIFRRFPDEDRRAMLHGNAIEAFDLPIGS